VYRLAIKEKLDKKFKKLQKKDKDMLQIINRKAFTMKPIKISHRRTRTYE